MKGGAGTTKSISCLFVIQHLQHFAATCIQTDLQMCFEVSIKNISSCKYKEIWVKEYYQTKTLREDTAQDPPNKSSNPAHQMNLESVY